MDELLVFSNNKTGDKVGVYYNAWLFIIKCILVKYAHKTPKEADEIIKKHYYKKPEDYDEQYWLKGVSVQMPIDYNEWYDDCLKENKLHNPFKWF